MGAVGSVLVHSESRGLYHGLCAGRLPALVRPKNTGTELFEKLLSTIEPCRRIRRLITLGLPCREFKFTLEKSGVLLRFVTALSSPGSVLYPLASHQTRTGTTVAFYLHLVPLGIASASRTCAWARPSAARISKPRAMPGRHCHLSWCCLHDLCRCDPASCFPDGSRGCTRRMRPSFTSTILLLAAGAPPSKLFDGHPDTSPLGLSAARVIRARPCSATSPRIGLLVFPLGAWLLFPPGLGRVWPVGRAEPGPSILIGIVLLFRLATHGSRY